MLTKPADPQIRSHDTVRPCTREREVRGGGRVKTARGEIGGRFFQKVTYITPAGVSVISRFKLFLPLLTSQVGVSTWMLRWIDQSTGRTRWGPQQTLLIYPSHILAGHAHL